MVPRLFSFYKKSTVQQEPKDELFLVMKLHIGETIKQELEKIERKPKWLADKIGCDRVNIYDIPPTRAKFFRFCSNIPGRALSYSDIRLFGVTKVNAATEKAGFFTSYTVRDFYPTPSVGDSACEVVDVTSLYRDGNLRWKAPKGRWRIYRFGYGLTGKRNGPASPEATGLEVDKLDREAVKRYYRNYFKMYDEASGGRLGSTISHLMIDSYEAECQNWTARMPDEFRARRGYSLVPWLPALAGEIIRSSGETERFLKEYIDSLE